MELVTRGKRGVFFSSDALIAVIIILLVILISVPIFTQVTPETKVHSDILESLSTISASEIDDDYLNSLVSLGIVNNTNKSVIDVIGELYVVDVPRARLLAESILSDFDSQENVGIWYGEDLIYSSNRTAIEDATDISVQRRVISGLKQGPSVTSFSARAFLTSNVRTEYFYFGGYVGDGNISALVEYNGTIDSEADLEIVISNDFDLYVNDVYQASYSGSPSDFEPVSYSIDTSDFVSGENIIEFRGESLFIAGGYLKITYSSSEVVSSGDELYRFPGIDGLVNLYDGFYLPANISGMNISIHLNSSEAQIFLNIGNVTVYSGNVSGEEDIFLSNATLGSLLDYSELIGENIPLRFGLDNVTYEGIEQRIDAFSVVDLSGSMDDNCPGGSADPGETPCGINDAKNSTELFIDILLNNSGNYIGLVGYEAIARETDYHELSNDTSSLKDVVNTQWDANGNTCICCGIERAVEGFLEDYSNDPIVAYYTFEGDASDSLGNYDGTENGNPTYETGVSSNAISCDGDDYVDIGDVDVSTEGTIAFWFKLDSDFNSGSSTTQALWGKYQDDLNDAFIALKGSDMSGGASGQGHIQVKMEGLNGGATYLDSSTDSWNADTWYHVALSWGSGTTRLYVDGAQEDSVSSSRNLGFSASDTIGRADFDSYNLGSTRYLEGEMDDFRIYSEVLSGSEISNLAVQAGTCNNGVVESGELCDSTALFCSEGLQFGTRGCNAQCDGYAVACELDEVQRYRSMVVMSDGEANRGCSGNNADSVDRQEAIDAAEAACTEYGIVTHAIGFGDGADEATLQSIALNSCNGTYYQSDATGLADAYRQIADNIVTNYVAQTVSAEGIYTKLYPESHISFDLERQTFPYGLVISGEKQFDDQSGGSFDVPSDAQVLSTRVASYSGPRWTSTLTANENVFFNISEYASNYIFVGDPYRLNVPVSNVNAGTNYVNITTASGVNNQTVGSEYNKIIYTLLRNVTTFSEPSLIADGCIWSLQFEDDNVLSVPVPSGYSGSDECHFNETSQSIEDSNDAYQQAVLSLIEELDINGNGKVDIEFSEQDLEIDLDQIVGIPIVWSTEVQVRRWAP